MHFDRRCCPDCPGIIRPDVPHHQRHDPLPHDGQRRYAPTTETFTLPAEITSLAVSPTGEIIGASREDADNDGFFEIYRLNNPFGTPNLTLLGDFLTQNTATLSFVDNDLLGIQQSPDGSGNGALVSIDLDTLTQITVGADLGQRHQASGWDPATRTFYANASGTTASASLYTIPFDQAEIVSQFVGFTDQNTITNGGEFFDGTYYQAASEFNVGLVVGSIDTATGAFTELFTLDNGDVIGSVGLAVIPAPGVASAFAMFGIAGLRRRR